MFSLFNKGRWLAVSFREGILYTISLIVMSIRDSVEVVSTNDESQPTVELWYNRLKHC